MNCLPFLGLRSKVLEMGGFPMTIYDGSARGLACDLFDRGLGYRVVAGRMPMVSRISMTGQIDDEAEICGGADVVGWVEIGASLVRRRILLLWDALYCRREPCSIVAGNRAPSPRRRIVLSQSARDGDHIGRSVFEEVAVAAIILAIVARVEALAILVADALEHGSSRLVHAVRRRDWHGEANV